MARKPNALSIIEHEMVGFALKICYHFTVKLIVLISRRYSSNHDYYKKIKQAYQIFGELKSKLDDDVCALPFPADFKDKVDIAGIYYKPKDIKDRDVAVQKFLETLDWFDNVNEM